MGTAQFSLSTPLLNLDGCGVNSAGARGVWFYYDPRGTPRNVFLKASEQSFRMRMAVYSGNSCDDLTCWIAFSPSRFNSRFTTFYVDAPTWIYVFGEEPTDVGSFQIELAVSGVFNSFILDLGICTNSFIHLTIISPDPPSTQSRFLLRRAGNCHSAL